MPFARKPWLTVYRAHSSAAPGAAQGAISGNAWDSNTFRGALEAAGAHPMRKSIAIRA